MSPDEAYRERIGERIARTLADALSSGAINEDDARGIADFVLNNIDNAKTSGQVLDFLTELATKWSIFGQLLTIELGTATKQKEDEALKNAEQLIKENRIDEAIQTVEEATGTAQGGGQNG